MEASLTVKLGERSYPIYFRNNAVSLVADKIAALKAEGRRVAVVTDRQVAERQNVAFAAMFAGLPCFAAAPGEESKSLGIFGQILDFLAENRLDRTSVLMAVGGGVIGDLAGYAAASYLRGIAFIQIPTTLLAMVDSSVGGKTGINLKAGKNLVGAFHQPSAVYIATDVLKTLPPREFAAGMAEVIKYGLLGDLDLFEQLEMQPLTVSSSQLQDVIHRCCAAKARIVEADERELAKEGGRALLNLGHTFGHAIEQVTGYGAYLHGEAVAIGLVAAAKLSVRLGLIEDADVQRVARVVTSHALPTRLRAPLKCDDLIAAVSRDKKVRAGMPRFVVMNRLGEAVTRSGIDSELVTEVFREVGAN